MRIKKTTNMEQGSGSSNKDSQIIQLDDSIIVDPATLDQPIPVQENNDAGMMVNLKEFSQFLETRKLLNDNQATDRFNNHFNLKVDTVQRNRSVLSFKSVDSHLTKSQNVTELTLKSQFAQFLLSLTEEEANVISEKMVKDFRNYRTVFNDEEDLPMPQNQTPQQHFKSQLAVKQPIDEKPYQINFNASRSPRASIKKPVSQKSFHAERESQHNNGINQDTSFRSNMSTSRSQLESLQNESSKRIAELKQKYQGRPSTGINSLQNSRKDATKIYKQIDLQTQLSGHQFTSKLNLNQDSNGQGGYARAKTPKVAELQFRNTCQASLTYNLQHQDTTLDLDDSINSGRGTFKRAKSPTLDSFEQRQKLMLELKAQRLEKIRRESEQRFNEQHSFTPATNAQKNFKMLNDDQSFSSIVNGDNDVSRQSISKLKRNMTQKECTVAKRNVNLSGFQKAQQEVLPPSSPKNGNKTSTNKARLSLNLASLNAKQTPKDQVYATQRAITKKFQMGITGPPQPVVIQQVEQKQRRKKGDRKKVNLDSERSFDQKLTTQKRISNIPKNI